MRTREDGGKYYRRDTVGDKWGIKLVGQGKEGNEKVRSDEEVISNEEVRSKCE